MFETISQESFGGGIFRGRKAPADSVYDALNALINDERLPFRRGGSAFYSASDAGATLLGLADAVIAVGQKTLAWSAGNLFYLDGGLAPQALTAAAGEMPHAFERLELADEAVLWIPAGAAVGSVHAWAGSLKTAQYATGTVSVTQNSATVTGVGTLWNANADAGMILRVGAIGSEVGTAVVKSVDSDTQITLRRPWVGANAAGAAYALDPIRNVGAPAGGEALAAKAVVANRVLAAVGGRIWFTPPFMMVFRVGDFHELPSGAQILGLVGAGEDTAVALTTRGVFTVSNMAFDALDDVGNVQHRVTHVNRDVILWGDPGLAAWAGSLLVPAIDDVYLMGVDGEPVPVSEGVRPLYRDYVEAGFKPGRAAVHRGHYFLPIVNGSNVLQDVLVCRLDLRGPDGRRRPAWTRWLDHATGGAYAQRVGAATLQPRLLGIKAQRVTELTGCFAPDASRKTDADGTAHSLAVITNDMDPGPGPQKHYVDGARVECELVDAASDNPTQLLSYATGSEGSAFTSAGAAIRGGAESDGTDYSAWRIRKDASRIRFAWATFGPAASAILKRVELDVEQAGW